MKVLLNDIKSARWAIMIIIAYFALLKNYIYTICPTVLFTGYPCPGCGMTRAMFRVLRLDLIGAYEMHPFIYPVGLLAVFFVICRYVLKGKYMNVLKGAVIIVAAGMIIFYAYRMVMYFPDVEPMTYYANNYINRLFNVLK